MGVAIAVVGPPHSGKSVFLSALYDLLRRKGVSFFLQRAAPDGEGMWSAESDQEIVREIRRKGKFTPEFVEKQIRGISRLKDSFDFVFVDTGGRRSPENREILKGAEYGVILVGDQYPEEEVDAWKSFLHGAGVKIIGILRGTIAPGAESEVECKADRVEGTLAGMRRGVRHIDGLEDVLSCIAKFAR